MFPLAFLFLKGPFSSGLVVYLRALVRRLLRLVIPKTVLHHQSMYTVIQMVVFYVFYYARSRTKIDIAINGVFYATAAVKQ